MGDMTLIETVGLIDSEQAKWALLLDDPDVDVIRTQWGLSMLRALREALRSRDCARIKDVRMCAELLSSYLSSQTPYCGVEGVMLLDGHQALVRRVLGKDAIQDRNIAGCVAGAIAEHEGAIGAVSAYYMAERHCRAAIAILGC